MIDQLLEDKNPSVSGILAGISKGKVWLFKEDDPIFAVTYSYCVGGCGLAGTIKEDNKNEIKKFIDHVIQDLKEEGKKEFEFSAEDKKLYDMMFRLYPEKTMHSELEYSYRLIHSYENIPNQRNGCSIYKVDKRLLAELVEGTYENASIFLNRYLNSWTDSKQFLTYSRAFVVIKENKIVGVIFGSSRYNDTITVDIEIAKKYRKQGLASLLTYHMLNDCAKDEITLQWDHVESNVASKSLAEKIGFHLFKCRPYYWFQI